MCRRRNADLLLLLQVVGERTEGQKTAIVELLGDVTNVYKQERQMSGRYK